MKTTSPNGVAFVDREEGEVDRKYKDRAGVWTEGVGHAQRPGETLPPTITHEEALAWLANDLSIAESAVNAHVKVAISQNAFDALVSFAFNCGGGALAASSALERLNAGDMAGAADGLLLWNKRKDPVTGALVVDQGLVARRSAERALFLTPDAITPDIEVDTADPAAGIEKDPS